MDILSAVRSANAIGIFGGGVTGNAVAKFCEVRGIHYRIFDESGGENSEFSAAEAKEYPLIVRSPGFRSSHKWVCLALDAGCLCVTELELASCFWLGKIVAITGTNGKTTTTKFIEHALLSCNEKAIACGNIGRTFIDVVGSNCNATDGWAIVEVSSFQMDGSTMLHPDYVIWTNFADDHLDAHGGMDEYFRCKANLIAGIMETSPQRQRCFAGKSIRDFAERFNAGDILEKCVVCTEFDWLPEGSALNVNTQRENFAIVQRFWECAGLPLECLKRAALTFKLPPHRLQKIAEVYRDIDGATVEFWDDSKATNFHALNGALESFSKPVILIAGGKSKNEPLGGFLKIIRSRVKALLLIGDIGETLCQSVIGDDEIGSAVICKFFPRVGGPAEAMGKAVNYAFSLAVDGDVILLSPGFSSLDWFKSYEERGKIFEDVVFCLNLKNK